MATNERVRTIYGLAGLEGQRHTHKNCQCWFSEMCVSGEASACVKPPLEALAMWAEAGLRQSHEEHQQAATELKHSYGMTVK